MSFFVFMMFCLSVVLSEWCARVARWRGGDSERCGCVSGVVVVCLLVLGVSFIGRVLYLNVFVR